MPIYSLSSSLRNVSTSPTKIPVSVPSDSHTFRPRFSSAHAARLRSASAAQARLRVILWRSLPRPHPHPSNSINSTGILLYMTSWPTTTGVAEVRRLRHSGTLSPTPYSALLPWSLSSPPSPSLSLPLLPSHSL